MSDERELEERLAEVEAENNAIKEYLGKLRAHGPSRRQVLKSGATVAGAGALGFSAGNASAQASTEDGDGNVGDPDDRVDGFFDGVDPNSVDNILLAEPGELQDKISQASAHQEVWAVDGAHDPGSETTIPEDVILRFVGGWFEPSSDYNGFYLEGGAKLLNCKANLRPIGPGYTSHVATVDSGRYGNAYRQDSDTNVVVEVDAEQAGSAGTGTGLHLRSTASGSVGVGCRFYVESRDLNVGLDLQVDGTFIQGGTAEVFLKANATADIRHRGSGPAALYTTGVIQASDRANIGIQNTTSSNSISFTGQWWDVSTYSKAALEGSFITGILPNRSADGFIGQFSTDQTSGYGTTMMCWPPNQNYEYYHAQEDEAYRWRLDNTDYKHEYNSGSGWSEMMRLHLDSGDIQINGTVTENAGL